MPSEFTRELNQETEPEVGNIWLNERPGSYTQLQWVNDDELLSPFALLINDQPVEHYVDLGTGTGAVIKKLAHLATNAIGIDVSRQMLDQVETTGTNIRLIEADLTRGIPLVSSSADLVTERMALHDLRRPEYAIQEAWRLVKPGGTLIVCENVVDQPNQEVASAMEGFLDGKRKHSPIGDANFYVEPSKEAVSFLRGLFALKHEPNRHLWTGKELQALVAENCPGSSDPSLLYSLKRWDTANWLEKSGFPIEACKQEGILSCLGAPDFIKQEWGLTITRANEPLPPEAHASTYEWYQQASSSQREAADINAFFYAAFATVALTKTTA